MYDKIFNNLYKDFEPKDFFNRELKNKISDYYLLKLKNKQIDIEYSTADSLDPLPHQSSFFHKIIEHNPNLETVLIFTRHDHINFSFSKYPIFCNCTEFKLNDNIAYNVPLTFDFSRDCNNLFEYYKTIEFQNKQYSEKKDKVFGRHGLAGIYHYPNFLSSNKGKLFLLSKIFPEKFDILPFNTNDNEFSNLFGILKMFELKDENIFDYTFKPHQLEYKINVITSGNAEASLPRTIFSIFNNGYTFYFGEKRASSLFEFYIDSFDFKLINYYSNIENFISDSLIYLEKDDKEYFKEKNNFINQYITYDNIMKINCKVIKMYNDLYKIGKSY